MDASQLAAVALDQCSVWRAKHVSIGSQPQRATRLARHFTSNIRIKQHSGIRHRALRGLSLYDPLIRLRSREKHDVVLLANPDATIHTDHECDALRELDEVCSGIVDVMGEGLGEV